MAFILCSYWKLVFVTTVSVFFSGRSVFLCFYPLANLYRVFGGRGSAQSTKDIQLNQFMISHHGFY